MGSRVYIALGGTRELPDGRRMMEFEVYAQEVDAAAPPTVAMPAAVVAPGNGAAAAAADPGDGGDDTRIPF